MDKYTREPTLMGMISSITHYLFLTGSTVYPFRRSKAINDSLPNRWQQPTAIMQGRPFIR